MSFKFKTDPKLSAKHIIRLGQEMIEVEQKNKNDFWLRVATKWFIYFIMFFGLVLALRYVHWSKELIGSIGIILLLAGVIFPLYFSKFVMPTVFRKLLTQQFEILLGPSHEVNLFFSENFFKMRIGGVDMKIHDEAIVGYEEKEDAFIVDIQLFETLVIPKKELKTTAAEQLRQFFTADKRLFLKKDNC